MKKITFIMLALVAFVATSCSSGYSEEKCKELCAKIEKGETLSQDEYSECIEQCIAIVDECKSKLESIKDDDENLSDNYRKFKSDTREMMAMAKLCGKPLNLLILMTPIKKNSKSLRRRVMKLEIYEEVSVKEFTTTNFPKNT